MDESPKNTEVVREPTDSEDNVDHATSTSNDYQLNILNEKEESISDSFRKSDDLISECKTIKNPENDCLKKRENIFPKKNAKIRKIVPSKKRYFNSETLVNSSSDSSRSTLFDSSILDNNSSELIGHGLKGKNIKCDFSPVSFSGLTASINAVKTIKPVLCVQNRNSLDMNNNNCFTNKHEPSCKSDTVQKLSDNYYTKYNSNTEALKDNCFKYCSSTKRKHFMNNSKNFCKGEGEKNFIPSEEMSSSSSLLGSKLSNYTVKPCYVILTRMKDIDAIAKRIGEKANLVKENIHKHNSQLEFELNCNNNEDKSALTKKIPYSYSRFENKDNDSIYVLRSKVNGSAYIVDFFEYENIKKIFVTIHMKEKGNLSVKARFIKNNLRKVTDKMYELGCYNKQNEKMFRGVPGLSLTSTYSDNKSNDVPSDSLNCAESSDSVCGQPGPDYSQNSPSKNTTVHDDSSDDSDDQCVHCPKKFADRKENFNHICIGKLEKGFLCMYCEKIFPSYLKLLMHKRMHFM